MEDWIEELTYEVNSPNTTDSQPIALKPCTFEDIKRYVKTPYQDEPSTDIMQGFDALKKDKAFLCFPENEKFNLSNLEHNVTVNIKKKTFQDCFLKLKYP